MSFTVLALLCLLQAWPSSTQFVFELELVSVATIDNNICDPLGKELMHLAALLEPCDPFLSIFCLREETSTQTNDTGQCPLGRNDTGIIAYTPGVNLTVERAAATRPGLPNGPVNRTITSQHPWPGTFQLYIEARELDPCCHPEDDVTLDDIFINERLEVNASFTPIERYNGTSTKNRVVLDMRFRVMCQQDYYGPDCTRLCRAQNDSVNGYYTCDSDGSIQCREGFRNTSNNCTEDDVTITSIPETVGRSDSTAAAAIGGGVGGALVVIIILIIILVVLILLVNSKRRADKPDQAYQEQHEKDNSAHQLDEKFPPTTAIYATPSSPEASVIKLENPVYGEIEDDTNTRDFQNPVYGDAEDDSAQQDELYTAPQAPQPVSLGMEGDGPEYDYATNPGAGAVTVNANSSISASHNHEYLAMDDSKRNSKMAEVDVTEPYERLHHGTEPPGIIRLAEVEGAEYGSLQ